MGFPDRKVLTFQFRAIQLNKMDWRKFINGDNPAAIGLMAKMNVAPEDRARVRLECIRLLARLKLNPAKMQIILGLLDTYLQLNKEEQTKYDAELKALSTTDKENVMAVTILWKEEGRQDGLRQGL